MISVTIGDEVRDIKWIEVRPGDGVIFRVTGSWGAGDLGVLTTGLSEAVRGGACVVYRDCCDTSPKKDTKHAEDCENAK